MKRLLSTFEQTSRLLLKQHVTSTFGIWVAVAILSIGYQQSMAQCAATTAPTVSTTTQPLLCPGLQVDLNTLVTSTTPEGTVLEWHTDRNNPDPSDLVTMPVTATGTYYAFYYDDVNNCYSSASVAVAVTNTAIPAVTALVTNNTLCIGASGVITFTGPTPLVNYEFGLDGGDTYQTSPTFTGLKAGNYSLIARLIATGCESVVLVRTVADAPIAIVAPTANVGAVTNCITPNGSLTVTAPTPLANYEFSIDGGINFQANNIFTGLPGGTYNVVVRPLATGCISPATAKVITTPTVTAPVTVLTNPTSCITGNGIITFTGPTPLANYQFSVDGGDSYKSSTQVTGLVAGVYDTRVKLISSGCESVIVPKTLLNPVATSPTASVTNNSSCLISNGAIAITAPLPLTAYQFSIDGGDTYQASASFTGLSANTYSVIVKQIATGCESLIVAKAITDAPVAITSPTISSTNPTNCNVPNGIIAITAPLPLTAYQFSIDGGDTYQSVSSFTGLTAGSYNVRIKLLATGCESAIVVRALTNPAVTSPIASVTNNTSCLTPNGAIAITGTASTTAYQFSIDGGGTYQTGTSFTGLSAGAYAVMVKLIASGCESAQVVAIVTDAPVAIAAPTASVGTVTNCITPNGSLTITGVTATTAYQASIDGGLTFQSGKVFTGLSTGSYEVIMRLNATGCLSPASNIVVSNTAVTAPTTSFTNNTSCANPNGLILVTAPTPLANYQFSIDGGDTFQAGTSFTGLSGGSYNVVSKLNSSGCESAIVVRALTDAVVVIVSPTISSTNPTSCAPANGRIVVTAPLPLASYEFSIDGGLTYQTSATFTGQAPGTYNVRIRSISSGCESAAVARILTGPAITAPVASVTNNTSCGINPNGIISFTGPTPLASYEFSIDKGVTFQTTSSFTGLNGGTYPVMVKQISTGCVSVSVAKALTNAPVAIAAPAATVVNITNCNVPNGSITFTSPTSLTTYQFSIDGGVTYASTTSFTGLTAGAYSLKVRVIATSCVSTVTAKTLTGPVVPAPVATVVNTTNCATPNGTITFSVPTAPNYEFSINGGSTFQTSNSFTGLASGNYTLMARLISSGCTSTTLAKTLNSPVVTVPTATVANNTTCFSPNGSINVTAPTPLTSYLFSTDGGANFQTNANFLGLAAGTYNVVIQSIASGCSSAAVAKIITNAPPAVVAPTTTQVNNTNCIAPNGVLTFTAPTPLASYQFSIDGGVTFQSVNSFTGLNGGLYKIVIKSTITGCASVSALRTLTNPTVAVPTATVINNTNCIIPNGTINVTAPAPLANYEFSINNGAVFQAGTSFTGLTTGTYPLVSRLVLSGCVSTSVAKAVTNPVVTAPITVVVNTTDCNSPNGKITFSGPTPLTNYEFSINGGTTYKSGINFTGLAAGTYYTRVRLITSGCESATVAKAIANPGIAAPLVAVVANANCDSPNGKITISAPIPLANYEFSIDGGQSFSATSSFLNLPEGTYRVMAKLTATGCKSTTVLATIAKPVITAPISKVTMLQTTCPATTISLMSAQPVAAANTTLEWHTVPENPSPATQVTDPTSVSTTQNYFLYAKSNINSCYSAASAPVGVIINDCTDTDHDGVPDYVDIDDDNDGIRDDDEAIACSPNFWSYDNFKIVGQSYIGDLLKDGTKVADVSFVIPPGQTGYVIQPIGISQTTTRVNFVALQSVAGGDHFFQVIIKPLPGVTIKSPLRIIQPGYAPVWVNHPGQHYAILGNKLDGTPITGAFKEVYEAFSEFNGLITYNSGYRYTNTAFIPDGSGLMDLFIEADNAHPYVYEFHQVDIFNNTYANERISIDVPQCIYGPLADYDGDGITNDKDLDSDNDGCSDALEAGLTTSQASNYSFSGIVGANGYMNYLETSLDNGTPVIAPTYSNAIDANIHACDLPCNAGTVAPRIPKVRQIVCPATTFNLNTIVSTNLPTSGTVVITWHTSATATSANQLTPSQMAAAPAGIYYAAFHDVINDCYSGIGWNGTGTASLTINSCNAFPTAISDIANTNIDTPVSGKVTSNDLDPLGGPLTAGLLSPPTAGTVTFSSNGTYTYTPPTGFTGVVSFCYSITNAATLSSSACVSINVNPLPLPPPVNNGPIANNDNTKVTAGLSINIAVLANDSDPDGTQVANGQLANPTLLAQPSAGTAVVNANGTVTYTAPTDFSGVATVPYQVCDKGTPASCATAVVSVIVEPASPAATTLAPVAVDDALITLVDTPKPGNVSTNDSDPQALPLTYTTGQPTNGTVVMASNGSYNYTPAPGFKGPDSFTYTVCNSAGMCAVGVVSLLVQGINPPTVAILTPADRTTVGSTNPPISGTATPGSSVTVSGPDNQVCVVTADNNLGIYTCTSLTFTAGPNSITVIASNAGGTSNTAISSFTATSCSTPSAGGMAMYAGGPLCPTSNAGTVTLMSNVGDVLKWQTSTNGGANWTDLVSTKNYYSFVDAANGQQYRAVVNSGSGCVDAYSLPVTIATSSSVCSSTTCDKTAGTISFSATPTATGVQYTTVMILTNASGVIQYASLPNSVSVTGVAAGDYLVYQVTYDNTLAPLPTLTVGTSLSGVNGACSVFSNQLSYHVCPVLFPPSVTPDIAVTSPGKPVTGNVLTNDSDPNGGPLTASLLSQPTAGTVTMSPTGSYTYTPPVGFTGTVTFCYSASNTAGLSASTCVTITVVPAPSPIANNAPIANNDNSQVTVGASVTINVAANDTDPDSATTLNGQLNAPVLGTPTVGTASVNPDGTVTFTPPANFTGVATVPYTICDKGTPPLCATAVISINVIPTPPVGTTLAPVAGNDALLTTVNTPKTGTVAANDSDPAGLTLSFTSGQPSSGTVVMTANGSYTYTPAPGYVGPDSFTYNVCNSAGKCAVATVSVNVQQPVTVSPPVATPDIANTNPGTPVKGNVLTNDTDPNGLPLTASLLTPPAVGTATINPDGSYTYTPPTGFTGVATFCYSVSNTAGLSSSACVTVNVNPAPSPVANDAPIANNDNTQTTAGTSVTINVAANDTDPDSATTLAGQLNTPTIVSQPTTGTASVNPDGTLKYTPPTGFTGVVSFPYSICDKATPALCATAVVSVNVLPTPPVGTTLSPVAVDDALLAQINTPKSGTVSTNDSDPAGLPLTYTSGQPTSGTVVMSPTGVYTYTPAPGFVGPDSFTYSVCNTAGKCDVATVSVNVQTPANLPPSVTPDFNNVIAGIPATGNVLTNDKDPEGTPLTASVVGTPPAGFTLSPDGSYTYTAPVGTTAPVTVPIQVCDGATPPSCATTTLTLIPVPVANPATNDAPIANPDAPKTTAGVPVLVAVLANDVDPEGQPLSNPTIVSAPTHGTAVVNPDGTVSYTPTAGYTGTDVLTYSVCDGGTPPACSTALVTFTIDPTPPTGTTNTAPVALDDALLTTIGTSKTGTVAANDSDPQGQPLTFTKLSGPATGTVVFSSTGSYTYVPAPGFVGSEQFTYQVCDNASPTLCTTATAYLTVQPSGTLPPVVTPDIANTNPGVPVKGNVLTNDVDPNGLPLTASLVTPPTAGTATISPDGSYTYTPPAGFTGTVSFCYSVSNTSGQSSSACVTVNVNPVPSPVANDAPIANNDNTQTTAGTSVTINVAANDTDPDSATSLNGQLNTPTIVSQPSVGTAVVNPDGTLKYTPPTGFTGVVSFPYQICDKATPALCATAVVSVNVQPTPPVNTTLAPVAIDDALLAQKDTPATGTVAANDTDPQGLPLAYTSGQPTSGTVVMSPSGSYTFTPAPGYTGPATFTYSVCNSAGKCDVATVSVTVQPPSANQAPIVTPDVNTFIPGTPTAGNVLTNDKDPEGTPLTATVIGTPPAGFTLSPDGSYTYSSPASQTAPVSVTVNVCDSTTPPACSTSVLTLTPVPTPTPGNDAPIALNDATRTTAGTSTTVNVLANDKDPEGLPLSNPTIVSNPTNGTATVNPDGTIKYTPAPGFVGVDKLTYQVCDTGTPPVCTTAQVTFTVDPTPPAGVTNAAPVAIDDQLLTTKGTPATGTVAANDSDPQGQPLVFAKLTNPASGTVVFSPTGSYTYVPAPGFVGTTNFTYQVCDNASPVLCATATAYITVNDAPTLAPIATPDIANTNPNTPVSGNVLTNDVDPQGGPLTASLLTPPVAGTVVISPNGSYTYTPPTGFTGTVSFCYSVSNTSGQSSSACVTVNVNPVQSPTANDAPIANNDNTQTTAGTSVTINVAANDTDPDSATTLAGQLNTPVLLSQPASGTATVVNGQVVYTPPAGFTGIVTFPYSICDKATPALCATALVSVTVQPTPPVGTTLAPVAIDDALIATKNVPKTGTVAANDSDPAGLPLTYTSGQPVSGTVVMSPNGSYTYTPAPGYVGPVSFTYNACNSAGKCDVATVSVIVQEPINQAPLVTPDFNNVIAGVPATGNVLTNDKDPEGTPLTASVIGTPPTGFTLSPDGSYTYSAPIGTTAPVTVPIQVCDGATPPVCATSTLTLITVPVNTSANDAPVANPDTPKTTTGVPIVVAVLANDVDPEGQPLSNPTIVSGPTHGTALVNPDGTVSYTPAAGFTGTDQLTYSVCDGGTPPKCSTALVTFTIDPTPPVGVTNTAPVAIDDALVTERNTPKTGTVAANDSDPQGQPLAFTPLSGPANGMLVFSPTGSYTYVPAPGFVGSDAFTYQVCDNASPVLCATATAHLTVQEPAAVTLPPVAQPDIANTNINSPVTGNVLTNDVDPQGGSLTAGLLSQPTAGTVSVLSDGTYFYTPPTGFTGTTGFCYSVTNSAGLSASACVSINVNPVPSPTGNDRPIANNDNTLTTSGQSLTIAVLANDVDPDSATGLSGQLTNPVILTPPAVGTALVNADGTITYTSPAGFTGVVTFPYQVCDKATPALCATAVVSVVVQPTPPVGKTLSPVAIDDALLASINTPASGNVSTNDSDPNNPALPLTYTSSQPASGTVVMSPNGSYTYTPAPGYVGADNFLYLACNSAGKCDVATVSILVQPTAPPTIAILSPAENGTATTTPMVSGTTTPNAVVTINGGPGSVGGPVSVTADATGAYSTSALTFPAGPNTVTATVTTPSGTATDVNAFTVVGPPSLTATVPPVGGLTQVVSGTTTPNTPVVITGPGPVTLCTTTASASGTFACPVSVTAGVTTLTVTATGPGGSSSVPVTVSAVAAPTVAILSPAENGTATTTPVVSGTTTPNAVVTLTGGPGSVGGPVSVTANSAGVYSTTALTFPAGPNTVTAVVTTPGGTATDVNAFTAVAPMGPASLTVAPTGPQTTTAPVVSGTATPGSEVITGPGPVTLCATTASATGTFSCTVAVPVGPNTLTVTACTTAGCATATTSFTSVASPTVAILSPAENGTATTTPTISGTATPGSTVTLTASNGSSVTALASPTGSYSATLPVTFPVGPASITATVTTPGGTVSDVNVFTAVAPAGSKPPVVLPDIANTSPGVPASGNVLTNDVDPQGGTLTASVTTPPVVGTLVMSPTGSYTYTPPAGFTGTVNFCYTATNTAGLSASTCVGINVVPDPSPLVNNPPVANNDNTQTMVGMPVVVTVLANDADPDAGPPDSATSLNGQLALPTLLAQPGTGTAVMNANGTVTYTPPAGFTGVVSFPYQVCDKATPALCTTALVTVTILPTPPVGTTLAPVAVDDLLLTSNTVATGTVAANDSDPQGLPLTYTSGQPANGTVTMTPTGTYVYTPAPGFSGSDSFTYAVCNSAGKCSKATVSVLVQQPINPNAVVLRLKVMLQGALIGGTNNLMRDDLRRQQFLPLTEPYTAMGGARFTHVNGGGGETMPVSVTALNAGTGDAVVDWVFVELRSPANLSLVVATHSAMVQRDGDVVLASDGVSPLSFTGLSGTSFWVSVKHRNHLGAMTNAPVTLSATGTVVDFTTSTSAQLWNKVLGAFNFEGWEQTTVGAKQALWAGDANHNGKVKYQGAANDLITIFSEVVGAQGTPPLYNYNNALGYYFGDVNMDGKVKYQGTANDTSLIFTNVITNYRDSVQMNSAQLYNFDFMLEQIPQ